MNSGGGKRLFLLILCGAALALFTSLGIWQVERRAWKLDLIERVTARVGAQPAELPPSRLWSSLNPRQYEYRRVRIRGVFRHDRETLVDALTERGAGSWVLTPLETREGTILINRGFVPSERRSSRTRLEGQPAGTVTVTGLMRTSEPGGRFLRTNRPAEDRWFSRDVEAIADKRGLTRVAPFFIDAEVAPKRGGYPIGGLTVIRFRNMHLIYALTWFSLAAMALAGLVLLLRPAHKRG